MSDFYGVENITEGEEMQRRRAKERALGSAEPANQPKPTDGNPIEEEYFSGAEASSLADNTQLRSPAQQPRGIVEEESGSGSAFLDKEFFGEPTFTFQPQRKNVTGAGANQWKSKKDGRSDGKVKDGGPADDAGATKRRRERFTRKAGEEEESDAPTVASVVQAMRREAREETNKSHGKEQESLAVSWVRKGGVVHPNASTAEIIDGLTQGVLYQDDRILGLYKPYGLAAQPGTGVGVCLSDAALLRSLAHILGITERLFPLQRLDKRTSGVILLAKGHHNRDFLLPFWKEHRVRKRYYAVTNGEPSPEEGIIDIPLVQKRVGGNWKAYPVYSKADEEAVPLRGHRSTPHEAVTEFETLSASRGAALLKLTLRTGEKHQIRSHLGFGLTTPILGDHKYSHVSELKPQRVKEQILRALGVNQSKARQLPTLLHAYEVMIPEVLEGRNLAVRAPLPPYFSTFLRKLKLLVPPIL